MSPGIGFAKENTLVSVKIEVGRNHENIFLYELLDELNVRKIGTSYPHSVKVNGSETDEILRRVKADDVIELFFHTNL